LTKDSNHIRPIPKVGIKSKDDITQPKVDNDANPHRLRVGYYETTKEVVWLACNNQPNAKTVAFMFTNSNKDKVKLAELCTDPSFSWCSGLGRPQGNSLKQTQIEKLHKERIDNVWQTLTGKPSRFNPVSTQAIFSFQ
jgi:hypothetical protein